MVRCDEMSAELNGLNQIRMPITEQGEPASARRAAASLSQQAGMDETTAGRLALVVTELATNLFKHARGGELLMRRFGTEGDDGVEVLSLDKGPGIEDVGRALGDGYSTAGSPGTGLGAVRRASVEFDMYSQSGKGTAVVARVASRRGGALMPPAYPTGIVHQAKPGEMVCGDEWVVRWFADGWICAVADGLGHGLIASEAAGPAIDAVRAAPSRQPPVELVEAAHRATRATRGAAFGVAVLDPDAQVVRFSGIGNVAAVIVDGDQRRHLVSHNGTLGREYHKAAEFSHPWSPHAVLIMHSDGIATHWDLSRYPGLLSRDPSLIAGILFRDYTRGRDDATVVVLKEARS